MFPLEHSRYKSCKIQPSQAWNCLGYRLVFQ